MKSMTLLPTHNPLCLRKIVCVEAHLVVSDDMTFFLVRTQGRRFFNHNTLFQCVRV